MKIRAYLQLTKACNLKCKMCDFWKNNKEIFPKNHFFDLIDIFIKNNIKWITFWWWEPFLNNQIYNLLKYSKENLLNTEIITNWLLIDKNKIKNYINYLDEILISIDSWISYVHENIRWKKWIFNKIIGNIEYLVYLRDNFNNKLQIIIDLTLQKDNYNNFDSILFLLTKYDLKLNFDPVQVNWYWNSCDKNLLLNEDEILKLEKKLINFKKENWTYVVQSLDSIKRIIKYFKWYKIDNFCNSLNNDLLVDSYWNVIKCWWNNEILYNIFEENWIKNNKLKMEQNCFGCWFSHVRDEDYFSGYSITNDLFNNNNF